MKRFTKISIGILVVFITIISSGCGAEKSESETIVSDSDKYATVEEMKSDIEGTYSKKDDLTNGRYTSVLEITSSTVIETATSTESGVSLSEEYKISEWYPSTGYIILEEDTIISVGEENIIYYGSTPYVKTESSNEALSNSENGFSALQITEIKIENNSVYTVCSGSIKNTGNKTYKYVKVKGAFEDSDGNVIDTESTYAVGSEGLAPDESTTFKLYVTKNYKIKSCEVSVYDFEQ
ncbi:MAG: FxLYD domain-containing protein [Clostridiales bacterium]|nr:FxLYD domain-containing protein [Clostridiales bacterium]